MEQIAAHQRSITIPVQAFASIALLNARCVIVLDIVCNARMVLISSGMELALPAPRTALHALML